MKPAHVKITIYNILGEKIETLVNKPMTADYHEIEFNAKNLASGIYFYSIQAGEFHKVKKMIYLR